MRKGLKENKWLTLLVPEKAMKDYNSPSTFVYPAGGSNIESWMSPNWKLLCSIVIVKPSLTLSTLTGSPFVVQYQYLKLTVSPVEAVVV